MDTMGVGDMMRLCRFAMDEDILLGFYDESGVVPVERAAEACNEATGLDLVLAADDDPLELIGPEALWLDEARTLYRWVEGLDADALAEIAIPLEDVRLLVPIPPPGKILLLAGNYAKHVEERGGVAAERAETFPYVFIKPTSTLTHPGDPIMIPKSSPDHIDWECELGVVIGKECRDVSEADALDYVAGYTVVNDVSDRKFAPNPSRKPRERDKFFDWLHGKWHDTFCPVGPCLLPAQGIDPQSLRILLRVNGETKQDDTTAKMVFPVAAVVSFLSSFMTLEPGDLIATGTPSGVGSATGTYLKPGDVVEASIEGIGVLRNPVR